MNYESPLIIWMYIIHYWTTHFHQTIWANGEVATYVSTQPLCKMPISWLPAVHILHIALEACSAAPGKGFRRPVIIWQRIWCRANRDGESCRVVAVAASANRGCHSPHFLEQVSPANQILRPQVCDLCLKICTSMVDQASMNHV